MKKAKELMKNLALEMAINAGRGFLNEQLKNVTPEILYEAIINDEDLWLSLPIHVKKEGTRLAKKFGSIFRQFYDSINLELILQWLKEDRPELFSIIVNTEGGIEWINGQIDNIKERILIEI